MQKVFPRRDALKRRDWKAPTLLTVGDRDLRWGDAALHEGAEPRCARQTGLAGRHPRARGREEPGEPPTPRSAPALRRRARPRGASGTGEAGVARRGREGHGVLGQRQLGRGAGWAAWRGPAGVRTLALPAATPLRGAGRGAGRGGSRGRGAGRPGTGRTRSIRGRGVGRGERRVAVTRLGASPTEQSCPHFPGARGQAGRWAPAGGGAAPPPRSRAAAVVAEEGGRSPDPAARGDTGLIPPAMRGNAVALPARGPRDVQQVKRVAADRLCAPRPPRFPPLACPQTNCRLLGAPLPLQPGPKDPPPPSKRGPQPRLLPPLLCAPGSVALLIRRPAGALARRGGVVEKCSLAFVCPENFAN